MGKFCWYHYLLIMGVIIWFLGFLTTMLLRPVFTELPLFFYIFPSLIIIGVIGIFIGVTGWIISYEKINIILLAYIFLGMILLIIRHKIIPIYIKVFFVVYLLFILLMILWKKFKK